jgi:hypothetical protein
MAAVATIRKFVAPVEEEDWEDVYFQQTNVDDLVGSHPHLQMFKSHREGDIYCLTRYYQTYGGGPEGGYFEHWAFTSANTGKPIISVYQVERTWGTPFTATYLPNMVIKARSMYETTQIKVVQENQ